MTQYYIPMAARSWARAPDWSRPPRPASCLFRHPAAVSKAGNPILHFVVAILYLVLGIEKKKKKKVVEFDGGLTDVGGGAHRSIDDDDDDTKLVQRRLRRWTLN